MEETKEVVDTIDRLTTLIVDLQDLREFLMNNPDLAEKVYVTKAYYGAYVYNDKQEFSRLARMLAKGRKLFKKYDSWSCEVMRGFGTMVELNLRTSRDTVCTKVVKGIKEIPEQVIPARTEEIVEWICK